MSKELLPLCSTPKLATRDGWTGPYARLELPFYGYWFASGGTLNAPSSTGPQNRSMTLVGVATPDTYQKAAGICLNG